jgi:flagellar basal-body rod protein FlgB
MDAPGLDRITNLLSQFLDVHSRRAQIVASNLANADTPGFQAQELEFRDYLRQATEEALTPGSMSDGREYTPRVVPQLTRVVGLDGNNVDPGQEMASLSNAGMNYMTGTTMLQSRIRTLRTAIREGR